MKLLNAKRAITIGLGFAGLGSVPATAALTEIYFISNGGSFINDTVVNATSPLGFTAFGATNSPF